MHPAVAYTSRANAFRTDRDDRALHLAAFATVIGGAILAALAMARRKRVRGDLGEFILLETPTRNGSILAFRRRSASPTGPTVVIETGLLSTQAHFEWIASRLHNAGVSVVQYYRAGYGPSRKQQNDASEYSIDSSVRDLEDLVASGCPDPGKLFLVGHSFGSEIIRRYAAPDRADPRLAGLIYIDPSHPAELNHSDTQRSGISKLTSGIQSFKVGTSFGLGSLLSRPAWILALPEPVQARAYDEYADARLWQTGFREWSGIRQEFQAFEGAVSSVPFPCLLASAEQTVAADQVQRDLHQDLVDAHQYPSRLTTIPKSNHDSILTSRSHAHAVAEEILRFMSEITR